MSTPSISREEVEDSSSEGGESTSHGIALARRLSMR